LPCGTTAEAVSRGYDPGVELADLDLPRLLSDRLLQEESELQGRLVPLLQPSELQRISLEQPLLQLRGAIALRARLATEKRCRHLLDAWRSQNLRTLEHCIAQLLAGEGSPPPNADSSLPTPAGADMEERIESLFLRLNADALRFQEAYYSERRHLNELDQRRCSDYAELAVSRSLPAA
jgi:DNA primase